MGKNYKRSGHVFKINTRKHQQLNKNNYPLVLRAKTTNGVGMFADHLDQAIQDQAGKPAKLGQPSQSASQASLASKAMPGQARQAGPSGRILDCSRIVPG